MRKRDFPAAEVRRLQAPRKLDALDAASEEFFEHVTPIAIVRPVYGCRRWFKSEQGLSTINVPRDVFFCGHANRGDGVVYISDQARITWEQNCDGK